MSVGLDAVPSAEAQLVFLTKLQRLFAEGDFAATYKFALLVALADLAVEQGADDGRALPLSVRDIARRFIQTYWYHTAPFGAASVQCTGVLSQNLGTQAAVLSALQKFQRDHSCTTYTQACKHAAFEGLVSQVVQTVSAQPLKYLQNFAGTTDAFLYERQRGYVVLLPGVAYSLRRFHSLVQHLARSHWLAHIKSNQRNRPLLGDSAADLERFLFATPRQSLAEMGKQLRILDGPQCFYCREKLGEAAEVDHFIPFAQYPRDMAHNFVLAHPHCNRSKSRTLAALPHVQRWAERQDKHGDDLANIGMEVGLASDAAVMQRVAYWSYHHALQAQGQAWLAPAKFEPVHAHYLRALHADQ